MTSETPPFDAQWPLRVEAYLKNGADPSHRSLLRVYYRHLLLELSGYRDRTVLPEPPVDTASAGPLTTGAEAAHSDGKGFESRTREDSQRKLPVLSGLLRLVHRGSCVAPRAAKVLPVAHGGSEGGQGPFGACSQAGADDPHRQR